METQSVRVVDVDLYYLMFNMEFQRAECAQLNVSQTVLGIASVTEEIYNSFAVACDGMVWMGGWCGWVGRWVVCRWVWGFGEVMCVWVCGDVVCCPVTCRPIATLCSVLG